MIIAVIQARMGSNRLPGKCMMKIQGKEILNYVVSAALKAKTDKVIVATTIKNQDDRIAEFCKEKRIHFIRGDEEDVLSRYVQIAKKYPADHIIRLTSDNILLDYRIMDKVVNVHLKNKNEYTSNVLTRSYAIGQEVEIIKNDVLLKLNLIAKEKEDREHVTLYIRKNSDKFKVENVEASEEFKWPDLRLCIDQQEDFEFILEIFNLMKIKEDNIPTYEEIIKFLRSDKIDFKNKEVKKKLVDGRTY